MGASRYADRLCVRARQGAVIGVAVAVSACLAGFAFSQVQAQTLEEALELTYQTNSRIRAVRAEVRAMDESAAQARALGRPTVNGSLSIQQSGGDFTPAPGADGSAAAPGTEDIFNVLGGNTGTATKRIGIEATQPIFQGFRVKNSIKEADARIEVARANLLNTEQSILFLAVQAYLQVVTTTEALNLAQNSAALVSEQLEAAQARFDTGQATKTDIAQAEARLAGAKSNIFQAEADLTAARLLYEKVTSEKPGTLEPLINMPALPATQEEALAVALEQNVDLTQARAQERASAMSIKVAKGALAPSLEATASIGKAYDSFADGDESTNATLGAQLTIPLFNKGVQHSAVRQAQQTNSADRFNIRVVEAAAYEETLNAWQQLRAAHSTLKAAAAQNRAISLAFEGVKLENELGQRTTIDVLNAEQELLQARLNHLQARENLYLRAFALRVAIGAMTADTLGLNVDVYDPDINKKRVQRSWIGFSEDAEYKAVQQLNREREAEMQQLDPSGGGCAQSALYRSTKPCGSRFIGGARLGKDIYR